MNFRYRPYVQWLSALSAVTYFGLVGCSSATEGFISDNPKGSSQGDKSADEGSTGTGTSGAGGMTGAPAGDDAERAITEADIIQVKDNKLYALSQYSGLSVIDISVKNDLKLLGRYQVTGIPFEMYLKGGIVYAMFSSWGQYVHDEATSSWSWVQSSRIEALDVTEPTAIHPVGSFDLPGAISDSRIVGDVLYAVTFEDGYCWNCQDNRNTTVTSLNVIDPETIAVVDQLSFDDNDPNGYGWKRSVSVTEDRMYVAGIEWNGSDAGHSTIDIVDISDPTGLLTKGASVEATGQIQSRWQMDEHEGILRVISQPGVWWSNAMPAVQTFKVVSSNVLQPLGYTELALPKPETLRSVRFDGARAFAITAEQTDPLFTIDLSDPAVPKQLGELEMPGWIYHMEPRGDRVLALGFDNAAPEGSLNVSLIDVSNMAQPSLIKRVAFGGKWSSLAEDQDRIHKAFSILDDLGLIMVPYSGYSYNDDGYGCGSYESGIQLIDFTASSLTRRGVAEGRGQARRAFVNDGTLFSVSDEQVQTFNISDRDAPAKQDDLALSNNVSQSTVVGDLVVRVSADWWTNETRLDVVPASNPSQAEPIGTLDLSSLAEPNNPYGCWWYGFYNVKLLSHGQHVYMVWPSSDWATTLAVAVDVSDPSQPKLGTRMQIGTPAYVYDDYSAFGQIVAPGDQVVQSGSTLIFRRLSGQPYEYSTDPAAIHSAWLEVIDFSNPIAPVNAATIALPDAAGHTALRIEGTTVMTSHWVPLEDDSSKARFYLDRIDIADPTAPVIHAPVNVPGSLVSFNSATGKLLTVDYQKLTVEDGTADDCYKMFGWASQWEPEDTDDYSGPGTCTGMRRAFKLTSVEDSTATLLGSNQIADGMYLSTVLVGDDRVFASLSQGYGYYSEDGPGYGGGSGSNVMVVGGMNAGALHVAFVGDEDTEASHPVAVSGKRLVMVGYGPPAISVLDATELDNLAFDKKADLASYSYDVKISGDLALCSLGQYGLQTVDISQ